jgi:hypothetical protein
MLQRAARLILIAGLLMLVAPTAPAQVRPKVCGVYTSILAFDSRKVLDDAIAAEPSFLMDKHKRAIATGDAAPNIALTQRCGFDTLFMTIYPLWGKDWWAIPAARNLVKDALLNSKSAGLRVHLGLSLFNGGMCDNPSRFPGALQTVQCDGTRPSWICFFDDALWDYYIRNTTELARLGNEVPGVLDGVFIDPEAYGPECYLCFCDNCVRKFNAYAHSDMPAGLVKPDAWLHAHGLWTKYTVDWHDAEVRRHATAMRDAIHAVNPGLQLSSLLWDYPVAVGQLDARAAYYRNLAIGLSSKQLPSWTMPEHTYYSDASDLDRIIHQVEQDIAACGFAGQVRVLPGIRLLRRPASSLVDRGTVIRNSHAPGYWMYELADLAGKVPIAFEGSLVDPPDRYVKALHAMNEQIKQAAGGKGQGTSEKSSAGLSSLAPDPLPLAP